MIKRTGSKKLNNKKHIYGPVPSRRLGYSLGIDLVPFKTCTFNCIYCQLGKTTCQTAKRKKYISAEEIIKELKQYLDQKIDVDFITFSGSGEPLLNKEIGRLIKKIKEMTKIPLAVITNSSLLYNADVRRSLLNADVVLPTLTTVKSNTFKRIHRPLSLINVKKIIDGLIKFRKIYKGKIWLEIMLIKGFNDSKEEIVGLKNVMNKIKPDRIQLNTVVRPPSETFARPVTLKELNKIRKFLGSKCEVVAEFKREAKILKKDEKKEAILHYLRRRPGTQKDIGMSLGIDQNELVKYLTELLKLKMIKKKKYGGVIFYETV